MYFCMYFVCISVVFVCICMYCLYVGYIDRLAILAAKNTGRYMQYRKEHILYAQHTYTYKHIHTPKIIKYIQDTCNMDWYIACICLYFGCITLLNVEYNTHTYTYMPHTGICNLIHTAYRFACICMYHFVSALYLFNAFVSACIYLLVYSCICMYVMIFACICMYEPNICLWIR